MTKVFAVSSGGGHWAELLRLKPSWAGADITYATTEAGYRTDVEDKASIDGNTLARFHYIPDANKDQKLRLIFLALSVFILVLRLRPDVIVSTGAAPGYFAIRFGKMLGARTVWIDSIANAEELSVSGVLARPYADLWLTQWPHLVQDDGPHYAGAVM